MLDLGLPTTWREQFCVKKCREHEPELAGDSAAAARSPGAQAGAGRGAPTPPPLLGRLRLSARTPQLKMAFLLITKKKKKKYCSYKAKEQS